MPGSKKKKFKGGGGGYPRDICVYGEGGGVQGLFWVIGADPRMISRSNQV